MWVCEWLRKVASEKVCPAAGNASFEQATRPRGTLGRDDEFSSSFDFLLSGLAPQNYVEERGHL